VPENPSLVFGSVFLDKTSPVDPHIDEMIQCGKELHDMGLASGTEGNLSFRTKMGFISSANSAWLDSMTKETVVEVRGVVFGFSRPSIYAKGAVTPSAETLLHSDVYDAAPDMNAIICVPAPEILTAAYQLGLPVTAKEQPAGSQELAQEAANLIKYNKGVLCFILKSLGVVALGTSLTEAVKLLEELQIKAAGGGKSSADNKPANDDKKVKTRKKTEKSVVVENDIKGGLMMNPNGPYPGRQLFIGMTQGGNPAVAYLVTGRSPASRERKASAIDSGIILGPIGNQAYDPLRHYTGVKYDNVSGVITVSNGIQTDAIFETYRLLYNTASIPDRHFMEVILDGAQAEPDSMHTPRIAAVITQNSKNQPVFIVGIKRNDMPAKSFQIEPSSGTLSGISTYKGSLENPEPYDAGAGLSKIDFKGKTAIELAEHLFEISKAAYNGDDIRVCAVGGIRSEDGHSWQVAMRNR
jgi:IMP cyclohydrolase